jgi:hypothetical protein
VILPLNVPIDDSWHIFAISPAFLPGFSLPAHSSRFSLRFPQCVSLRDELKTLSTFRLRAHADARVDYEVPAFCRTDQE